MNKEKINKILESLETLDDFEKSMINIRLFYEVLHASSRFIYKSFKDIDNEVEKELFKEKFGDKK